MSEVNRGHLAGLLLARKRLAPGINDEKMLDGLIAQASAAPEQEAVAVLYEDGTILSKADCGIAFETCCRAQTPLYTHADDGEVERLRGRNEALEHQAQHNAEVAAMAANQTSALRHQLAERDALLHDLLHQGADEGWLPDEIYSRARGMVSATAQPAAPCSHEWTDDGLHLLICTACGAQEDHDPHWRDMASAPRDGTMLRLLVEFSEHSTEDADQATTIGANNLENDGDDRWQFAGWCWSHDHFTEGKGEPVGWLPMLGEPRRTGAAQPAGQGLSTLMREHRIAVTPEHEGQWHADLYGFEAEPLFRAEGDTPDLAVRAVVSLLRASQAEQEQAQ